MLRQNICRYTFYIKYTVAFGAGLWGYYAPQKSDVFEEIAASCGAVPYFSDEEMMHGFTALAGSETLIFFI